MSQSRARKTPNGSDVNKNRASVANASGDNVPCSKPKEQNHRSRSKNKIPKSIRYDLENALVGLCDVWFEDIKPHLVRNNIKLHVDGIGGAPAGGDHNCLPAGAPECSHLDPASSSVECELCRLLFSAANSIESAVSQAASASSSAGPASTASVVVSNNTFRLDSSDVAKPSGSRNWRVPRLCRSYLLNTEPHKIMSRFQTTLPRVIKSPPNEQYIKFMRPYRKVKTLNKYTQTDFLLEPRPETRESRTMARKNRPETRKTIPNVSHSKSKMKAPKNPVSPMVDNPQLRKHRPAVPQKKHLSPQPRMHRTEMASLVHRSRPTSPPNIGPTLQEAPPPSAFRNIPLKTTIASRSVASPHYGDASHLSMCVPNQLLNTQPRTCSPRRLSPPPGFSGKTMTTTAFYPSRFPNHPSRQSRVRDSRKQMSQEESTKTPLFDKDLIDIIGQNNDKRLRVLYRSPNRGGDSTSTSVLNLCSRFDDRQIDSSSKIKPWR